LSPVSVSVVNKPGGGQSVAFSYLNTHPGNPHFLGLASSSWLTTVAGARGGITHRDITPISRLFTEYQVYYVRADSPIRNMADVRDALRRNPGALSFAYQTGAGNPLHISIADVAKSAGIEAKQLRAVVYDSGSVSATQVAGGHVDIGVASPGSPMSLVQAGKLRYIGVAGPQRLPGPLADVPTLREQGLDVLAPISYIVMAPKGVTLAQSEYWDGILRKVVQTDEIRKDMAINHWVLDLMGPRELPAYLDAQYEQYRQRLIDIGLVKP
jgi:putative tricarboxylic transport membrane protein